MKYNFNPLTGLMDRVTDPENLFKVVVQPCKNIESSEGVILINLQESNHFKLTLTCKYFLSTHSFY